MPNRAREEEEQNLDDVHAVFDGIEVGSSTSLYLGGELHLAVKIF